VATWSELPDRQPAYALVANKESLRKRLEIRRSAVQLANYLAASVELMQMLARACGHAHLNQFTRKDLTTWKREMADLTGVPYAGG